MNSIPACIIKCVKIWTLFCLTLFVAFSTEVSSADDQPNFLVIIADDMGYSDAGCYGGEIETPNLDRLAEGGLRFTQFYNTARCWPTRSALITGYYPQEIRRDGMPGAPANFGGRGKRPEWAKTVAEHLRPAGYRTYHSGKWHIDGEPTKNGFDRSDQTTRGPGFFETIKKKNRDPNYYETVDTANFAIECLQEHATKHSDKPFFAYVAFRAPHFPLHALPEDIERYRERYIQGWDVLRKERHERQKGLGIDVAELSPLERTVGPPYAFPEHIKLLGAGEINRPLPWSELTEEQKSFQSTKMSIHAAMVDRVDREIGRILEQLKAMDAMENTFICFLSDNGASAEIMVRGDGHDATANPGSAETYLCLGPGFSSAANTPFRRHKTWVHEGGISTPFIVHWPKGISAKNEFRSSMAHVIDITPTILDLAGVKVDAGAGPSMAGVSLKPAFDKDQVVLHEELWFYHNGNRALRQGNWKIVYADDSDGERKGVKKESPSEMSSNVNWHLFNLATDRAEQQDLSDGEQDRVQTMSLRWEKLRKQFLNEAAQGNSPSE